MACSIGYIQKENLSEAEKLRLEDIHVNVFTRAKQSGFFRQFENKLYSIKQKYGEAVKWVNDLNKEHEVPISKLNQSAPGQHYLSVDVLPLSNEKQEVLFQKENASISSVPALRTFDFGSLEGQPQTEAKNKAIHNNIINIPDELMSEEGETFNQAAGRSINEISNIVDTAPANTVVITHNSVFGVIKLWDKEGRPSEFDKAQRKAYVAQDGVAKTGDIFPIQGKNGPIYIVRHGETLDNVNGNFRSKDVQLTANGVKQAKDVGESLKDVKISQIIASPLSRAQHTAELILSKQKGNGPSVASEETINKIKEVAKKMGIDIQELSSYAKKAGINISDIRGIADLVKGVVAVAEGKESEALTEEVIHIATAILEQTHPELVTEMISKIDRFKIYKRTLELYRTDKNYQLPDGRPDIRMIKKEAVDKLIAEVIINNSSNLDQNPELRQEENISLVRRMWQAILDTIKGMYRRSNLSLFEEAAKKVEKGVGTVSVLHDSGLYFQKGENKTVDDVYNKILDIDSRMKLIPQLGDKKRHYTFDGVEVAKTVTEKVKEHQPPLDRTPEQKIEDEQKRAWGSEGHEYVANYISNNLIDENGYALPTPKETPISTDINTKVAEKLQDFAKQLIASYKPGTRFIVEKKVINEKPKGKIASTMDFVAIEPDEKGFKMDIFDWKFMNINTDRESDVPWYKTREWNSQMGEYANIMYNYGVKSQDLRKARMMPFQVNYKYKFVDGKRDVNKLLLTSIEIGKLDVAKETNLYLLPVPLETESTGDETIDKLTRSLREYQRKLYKVIVSPEDQHKKNERLNELSKAIRSLHVKRDFTPLVSVGTTFLRNADESFKKFENIDYDKLTDDQVNALLGELLDMKESAGKFSSLDEAFLRDFEKEGLSKEDKETLADLERISASTKRMTGKVNELFENYVVYKALKEGVTTEETKENILNPELEIGGFAKSFLEGSQLPARLIQFASNLIQRAKKLVSGDVNKAVDRLAPLLIQLQQEAKNKGKSAFDLIGNTDNGKLNLVSKVDKEFKKEVYKARKDKNKKFFMTNMDMKKYKELAEKTIKDRIEEQKKKHFSNDEEQDTIKRDAAIAKIRKSLNIDSENFNGFEDYDFRRLFWETVKEEDHLSKEYKEMSEDAKKVWQFFTDLNAKAKKLGYLTPQQGMTFFPLMEATILEKLGKADDFLSQTGDILKDAYTVRVEEEYSYSKIDEETGELKKEIPKRFTRTRKDVTKLSTDLNKVGVLYINALAEYESSRAIENTLLVLHNVEKNKGRIITGQDGKPIFEAGVVKTAEDNEKNAGILQTIIDDGIYGLKENLSSIGNLGLAKVIDETGKDKTEEEKEQTRLSTKKTLENANKLVQSLAVGLKLLVAIPNYIGFNMQAAINAGRLITFAEFEKNNARITAHTSITKTISDLELALLDRIQPLNDSVTQEARRKLGKKQGLLNYLNTWSFHDVMMVTNSFPDRLLQYANALSFLENTMIVDGKLVNIRQFVAKQDRDRYKGAYYQERRALEKSYEDRVKKLKDEKSLPKVASISEDGLVIPGVSDAELAKYSVKIVEFGRNLSGQMNQNNKADYRRDTIMKSFMMFKGWIPKQISLRTLDIKKNLELDEWEYGRTRAFIKTIQKIGLRNITDLRDVILGTDKGLQILKEMYDSKKDSHYKKTGQQLEISEEEFFDLIRNEVKNQMKELALLASLVGLIVAVKLAEPPPEEDDVNINKWKFWAKASNKIADELWFYYNPLSFEAMTRGSVLPALGLLTKAEKFFVHLGREGYGELTDDQSMIDKAHPQKYFFNLMPVASQIQNELMPIIDPEWAKEQGIISTSQARPR